MRNFKEKKHTQYFGKNDEQEHFMKQKLNELDHKTEKKEQKNSTTTTSTAFERIQFWRLFKRKSDSVITIHLHTNKQKNQIGNFLTYRIKPPAPPSYY